MQINLHEAKAKLSALVEMSVEGEEVIIAKAGKPLARLVRYEKVQQPRTLGILAGKIIIPDNFNDEDQDINDMFYGAK
jgi:prevent-host-death family protein